MNINKKHTNTNIPKNSFANTRSRRFRYDVYLIVGSNDPSNISPVLKMTNFNINYDQKYLNQKTHIIYKPFYI